MRVRFPVLILSALFCVWTVPSSSAAEKSPAKKAIKAPAPVGKAVKAPAKAPAKKKVPAKKPPQVRPPRWSPSGKAAPLKIGWARCDVSTDLPDRKSVV